MILDIVDDVWAVDRRAVGRAKAIVLEREQLSARDALHAALMERNRVNRIASFDIGFDQLPGIERVTS